MKRQPDCTLSPTTSQHISPLDLKAIMEALIDLIVERISGRIEAAQRLRPRLLTVEEAARYLGRSEKAIYALKARGAFPAVQADGRIMFDVRDLDQWIDQNKG